jgi:hypothetical protein
MDAEVWGQTCRSSRPAGTARIFSLHWGQHGGISRLVGVSARRENESTGHRSLTTSDTPLLRCEPVVTRSALPRHVERTKGGSCQAPLFCITKLNVQLCRSAAFSLLAVQRASAERRQHFPLARGLSKRDTRPGGKKARLRRQSHNGYAYRYWEWFALA